MTHEEQTATTQAYADDCLAGDHINLTKAEANHILALAREASVWRVCGEGSPKVYEAMEESDRLLAELGGGG